MPPGPVWRSLTSDTQPAPVYALVAYLPDPAAAFLDSLRLDLAPGCNPRAHITILPPRTSAAPACAIEAYLAESLVPCAAFDVELGEVERFSETGVVYVELRAGAAAFCQLHAATAGGPLAFVEAFPYHPHVTLAQEIPQDSAEEVFERARRRWREYAGPRRFRVEAAVLVRNERLNLWLDLRKYLLAN